MAKKRIRIVNKIRFSIFIFTISVLLVLLGGTISNIGKAYSTTYDKYLIVKVNTGDTLWEIAKKHNKKKQDIRRFVYRIMKINNMENARLYPGDTIKIPTD